VFSCSKIEQKQLNTWVSFRSAEQPLLGQFSVSGNSVTYATVDSSGIYFESELAIQLNDGSLTTLRMPTQLSERQAIQQWFCGRQAS